MTIQMSRRSLLKSIGLTTSVAALGIPLSACGNKESSSGAGDTFPFMSWDTPSGSPLHTVATNWANSASRKIDVQSVPGADYDTKLRTVLASGSAPGAIRINDDYVKGYYAEGSLLDLRTFMDRDKINPDDYFPVAFNFAKQEDGAHAAWPIMANPGVIYCNVDLFKEAGVPLPPTDWSDKGWTWDEFLEAAKKLTKPGGEQYGALIFPDTSVETIWPVNNGSDGIYSMDATRFTLADKESTDALQFVADLALVHKVHPDFATVKAGTTTPNWALSQFATGKVAMLQGLTSGSAYLRENAKMTWDMFPPPGKVQQKTVNTLTVLAIPKDSPDPDAAWEMLKFCANQDSAKVLAATRGFMPVLKSSAELFVSDGESPSNTALIAKALEHAVNENFSRYIERARTVYRPVLDTVWNGEATAAEALGSVKAKVEEVLAGQGG